MCTTAAKKIEFGWVLMKTRDPVRHMRWDDEIKLFDTDEDHCRKLIVQNPDSNEDGYYGGINEHGVAFVSTYVHVAENQVSYIRRPYVRLILEAQTAKEATEIIKSFNPRIGGNMLVADKYDCFGIEGIPSDYYVEQVHYSMVKTNHFVHFPFRNLGIDEDDGFETWSRRHQERAEELIAGVSSVDDCMALLRDRKYNEEGNAICSIEAEDECFTHSAFVFDTSSATAYYCQGNPLTSDFKSFGFE